MNYATPGVDIFLFGQIKYMPIPEILKYFGILSYPLFSVVALLLTSGKNNYSLHTQTISKSILHLDKKIDRLIFRSNFLVKMFLDLGFYYYMVSQLHFGNISLISFTLTLSALSFGLMAYFVEGIRYKKIHLFLAYGGGIFWTLGIVFLSMKMGDNNFVIYSTATAIVALAIAFGFLFAKKTNVHVQTLIYIIMYVWTIIFTLKFL